MEWLEPDERLQIVQHRLNWTVSPVSLGDCQPEDTAVLVSPGPWLCLLPSRPGSVAWGSRQPGTAAGANSCRSGSARAGGHAESALCFWPGQLLGCAHWWCAENLHLSCSILSGFTLPALYPLIPGSSLPFVVGVHDKHPTHTPAGSSNCPEGYKPLLHLFYLCLSSAFPLSCLLSFVRLWEISQLRF